MTVRELVEANPFCDAVEIVVREHGSGNWIQGYRVSKKVEQWRSEYTVERKEVIKLAFGKKPPALMSGEIRDVMQGYHMPVRLIKKGVDKIPEEVMRLNVCNFIPHNIKYLHPDLFCSNEHMLEINCYPEGFVPEKKTAPKQDKENTDSQLPGQMSIYDLMGGNE